MGCACKYVVLGVLCTGITSLVLVVLSATTMLRQVYLIQSNVTDHKVNQTIFLGALAYCNSTSVNSTNVTCSAPGFGYLFADDEVSAQVWGAPTVIKVISLVIPGAALVATLALCVGLVGSFMLAKYLTLFGCLCALVGGTLVVVIAFKSSSGLQGLASGFYCTVYGVAIFLLVAFFGFLEANFQDVAPAEQRRAGPGGAGEPVEPGDEEQARKQKLLEILAAAREGDPEA